ncbi:MAG TPA: SMI1/KNR4 family protein [Verrucomicrobiae bacterium]
MSPDSFITKRRVLLLLSITSVLGFALLLAVFRFGPGLAGRMMFYPSPPALPPEIQTDVTNLLAQLELELQTKAPQGLAELKPGLSPEAILEIERKHGLTLPPDIRALYQWRNGQPSGSTNEIIPGHYFQSLEDAVMINKMTQPRGVLDEFILGHQRGWLPIFGDGASDGYFLDTAKTAKPGHFFYHMAEDSHYIYFTSFRNFLAGLNECYAQNIIRYDPAEQVLTEDYQRSQQVWSKYATDVQP